MEKKEMLTTQEIASEFGVAYQTVMAWIYNGAFPNAQKEETPRGSYYLVPRSDLDGFKPQRRGRPSKKQTDDGEVSTGTDAADNAMPAAVTAKKAGKKSAKK